MSAFRRRCAERTVRLLLPPADGDRGDVPGWVLITVMTAGLVSALWIVADEQLSALFSDALGAVSGP